AEVAGSTAVRPGTEILTQSDVAGDTGAGRLPRTGGVAGLLLAVGLVGSGQVLRRLRRRNP
ncbi:MAG: hypothetical protein ACRDYV_07300, partial [Acidimicrobiia bacterium]